MESRNSTIFTIIVSTFIVLIVFLCFYEYSFNEKSKKFKKDLHDLEDEYISLNYRVIDDFEDIQKQMDFYNNLDEETKNLREEYITNISLLEQKILKGETDIRIAYLTFDDGPYDLTANYLNLLKNNDIRATFFVMYRDGYEDTYRRIVNEGHTLGNHTYNHAVRYGLYSSTSSFLFQVQRLQSYLYDLTGYTTTIVRFPCGSPAAGSLKSSIVHELFNLGYAYVDWGAEVGDGSSKKLAQKDTYSWFIDTLGDQKIVVLLMHDYSYSTYNNLQKIIDHLKSNNYLLLPLNNKSVMVKNS